MSFNPYELILSKVGTEVTSLETYKTTIKSEVDVFRSDLFSYNYSDITELNTVQNAVNDMTPEAFGISTAELGMFSDFADDCLNQILGKAKQQLNKVFDVINDSIDSITSLVNLAENALIKKMQDIWSKIDKYNIENLISSLDLNIDCVINADALGNYASQIQALNTRINTVISDLYLDATGTFSFSTITSGASAALVDNLKLYYDKAGEVKTDITNNVTSTIDSFKVSNINPQKNF